MSATNKLMDECKLHSKNNFVYDNHMHIIYAVLVFWGLFKSVCLVAKQVEIGRKMLA